MIAMKRHSSLPDGSSNRPHRDTSREHTLHAYLFMMVRRQFPQYSLSSVAGMPPLQHFMRNRLLVSGGFTNTLLNRLTTRKTYLWKPDTMILAIAKRVAMIQAKKFATMCCESGNQALTVLNQTNASAAFELALSFGSVEAGDALCEMYDLRDLNPCINHRVVEIARRLKTPTAQAIYVIEWCDRMKGWPSFVAMDMRLLVGGNCPCSLYAMSRLLEFSGDLRAQNFLKEAAKLGYHRAVVDYARAQLNQRGFTSFATCSRLVQAAQNCSPGAITMIVQLLQKGMFRTAFFSEKNSESLILARGICQHAMDNGVVEKEAF